MIMIQRKDLSLIIHCLLKLCLYFHVFFRVYSLYLLVLMLVILIKHEYMTYSVRNIFYGKVCFINIIHILRN